MTIETDVKLEIEVYIPAIYLGNKEIGSGLGTPHELHVYKFLELVVKVASPLSWARPDRKGRAAGYNSFSGAQRGACSDFVSFAEFILL